MQQYSIQDFHKIAQSKAYITEARFLHFFVNRHGFSERDARFYYKQYFRFPNLSFNDSDFNLTKYESVISECLKLVEELHNVWSNRPSNIMFANDERQFRKKILYKENSDEIKELEVNLAQPEDVIIYADLLKRKITNVAMLDFCIDIEKPSKINEGKRVEKLNVYEGDLFNTFDDFWDGKSNIFVAEKNGTFRRLLYIKGKGYLDSNGDINIDTEKGYSDYAVASSGKSWQKIGNIYIDTTFLKD